MWSIIKKIVLISSLSITAGSFLLVKIKAAETIKINIAGTIHTKITGSNESLLRENPNMPKVFFALQVPEIDLSSYVTANDTDNSDITHKVKISTTPEFDNLHAGEHRITYTVADRLGNEAKHTITLTIWNFIKIESGEHHSLALTSHGKVYAWGRNLSGQIGDNTITNSLFPKLVEDLDNIVDIAASRGSSYALRNDGKLFAWGYNIYGKLGDNSVTDRRKPVPVKQPENVIFTKISANYENAAALDANGNVYSWGYALYGATGAGNTSEHHVPTSINLTNIADISMGRYNGAAITTNGELYTWGSNYYGQLGDGSSMTATTHAPRKVFFDNSDIKISHVSMGDQSAIAITQDGDVYAWGEGSRGKLGNNSTAHKNTPQKISFPTKAVEAETAETHSCVRLADGAVYYFGYNDYSKLAIVGPTQQLTPYLTPSVDNATGISLSISSSFILIDNTIVYGVGYGAYGNFGNGLQTNSTSLTPWKFTPPLPY